MNREELIRFTNKETGVSMRRVRDAIDIFTDAVIGAVAEGEDVKLSGFGSFKVEERKGTKVTDPRTVKLPEGERRLMDVPAKRVVKFEPGSKLRTAAEQQKKGVRGVSDS